MLRELSHVRQVDGEPRRRWFSSTTMDLIVWGGQDGAPSGFQFCYDKGAAQKALTWRSDLGYSHMAVDDGESNGEVFYKGTPILVANGNFDSARVTALFLENGRNLPDGLREFICARLREYPHPAGR